MLDDRRLVVISAEHNHLPPFLSRNQKGTVSSFLSKSQSRPRREKPTLGPRATRYEVDCLVASIMQEMEFNRKQPTEPQFEADVAPNNNSVAPRIVVKDLSSEASEAITPVLEGEASTLEIQTSAKPNEGLPQNKIDISSLKEKTHQNEFASYVYHSATNKTRALTKLMAGTLGSEPTCPHAIVVKTSAVRHEPDRVDSSHKPLISPVEENPIVVPTEVDVPIKQEAGLQPNQMYIVLPPANSDATKVRHNRFIIPSTQNTSGIIFNNKILLSPVKTEACSETSGVQAKRNEPCSLAGNILNKDGNPVTANKMFIVVRTNDCGSILQNNEKVTKMTDKVPNKMFILVHNKNEKDIAVAPADIPAQPNQNTATTTCNELKKNELITQKTVLKTSIPISSIKNIILPPKTKPDSGTVVISKKVMSSKKSDGVSVAGPSKMNSFPPKTLSLSSNINITSAPETGNQLQIRGETGSFIPRLPIKIPKRTEAVSILRKKAQTIMPVKINTMTQTLPLDFILDDQNMPLNQIKALNNNDTVVSGASRKKAGNEGNIPQENNLDIDTKVSSMLPVTSPKTVKNTYEMQKNMPLSGPKSIETDSPECMKQQTILIVKTEAGTLEVCDKIQTKLANKTENECEILKQDCESGIVSLKNEQPTASKQQLIMPDEAQIIHSVSYSKQPMVSTATEDSIEIHLTPMIKNEIIKVFNETQLTTAHKDQSKTPGHSKSQDDLSPIQNIKCLSPITIKSNESPTKIDLDWIVPRNKDVQTKINTNFTSKDLKQTTDVFLFGKTSNIPEIPISVSMIPLPDESTPLVSSAPKTVENNVRDLVSVGEPLVMIERLSIKRKAGRPSMCSVPPKKRHYQPGA